MWEPKTKKKKEKLNTRTYKHTHTHYCFFLLFSFTRGQQSRDRRTSTFFFFYWILYTDWIAHLASDPLAWIGCGWVGGGGRSSENIQKDITLQACVKAQFYCWTQRSACWMTVFLLPCQHYQHIGWRPERECERRGFVIFLFWTLTVIKSAERMKSIQKGWQLHCGDP